MDKMATTTNRMDRNFTRNRCRIGGADDDDASADEDGSTDPPDVILWLLIWSWWEQSSALFVSRATGVYWTNGGPDTDGFDYRIADKREKGDGKIISSLHAAVY